MERSENLSSQMATAADPVVKVTLSVVLCTYNRAPRLASVIKTLADFPGAPGLAHEIIVVDNNSTDETRAMIEAAVARQPDRIRYVFEGRQGLSWARNRGIEAARGELIAFTDDDVVVDPGWIAAMARAAVDYPHAGFGGRVWPVWDFEPPPWFVGGGRFHMLKGGVIVGHNLGDDPIEYKRGMYSIVGANMAFRRRLFERVGLFRTDLGKTGKRAFFGEDADMFVRALAAGEPLLYLPQAVIYHPVDREKMTQRHFVVSYFNLGRSIARFGQRYPPQAVRYFGVPRYLVRMLIGHIGRGTVAAITGQYKIMLHHLFESCWLAGQVLETARWGAPRSEERQAETVDR